MDRVARDMGVRRTAQLTSCWVALIVTLATPARGFADSPATAQSEAKHALEAAGEAYDHGRFAEALADYERSYRLRPIPKALLGIARAAESAGERQRALSAYQTYLHTYPEAFNRKQIEARVQALSAGPGPGLVPAPTHAPAAPPPASMPAPLPSVVPQPAPYGTLSFLPTEEILARQRMLQQQLTTRDGISLGAPITLLVLGLLTAGPVGGTLLAAGIAGEEATDSDGYHSDQSIPAFVIPGAALIGVGVVTAVTGAVMIGVRRSRARGIRHSLSEMDGELQRRQLRVSLTPYLPTGPGSVAGLAGSVRF